MISNLQYTKEGELLSNAIINSDIRFDMPCSGNGICGKCKVKVTGSLSQINHQEKRFLTDYEIEQGFRLACFTRIYSDVTVEIDDGKFNKILTESTNNNSILDPIIKNNEYGISVDIGTTTIVMTLLKGDSLYPVNVVSETNNQKRFGADVISRIDYSINNSVKDVYDVIINQLNTMIKNLCSPISLSNEDIKFAIVTGNTTMLHFFANLDPKNIAFAPFTPKSLFGHYIKDNINLDIAQNGKIYIPPCISGYVGADLVCGILASNIIDKPKITSFIVDIGTNGEMALFHNDTLVCCSTAAGPAFEGVGLNCGSPSIEGAISMVYFDKKSHSIKYETINDMPPLSICGSGIIDVISIFLELGILDRTGKFLKTGHDFTENICIKNDEITFQFNDCNVYISQKDIRQIQLAKAAIAGGISTLLINSGLDTSHLDEFNICGGFGTYLNLKSSENIGLIPSNIINKTLVLGNTAISGASSLLLNRTNLDKCNKIKDMCSYLELSTSPLFMDQYIQSMSF